MRAFDQDADLWEPACAPQHQDADLWGPACAPQHMHDSPWSGSPRVSMLCHLSGKACYNSWNMFKDLIQYEMQTQNLQPYIQYFINTSQKFCAKHWDNWVVIGYSVLKYNILSEILIRGTVETKLTDSGSKMNVARWRSHIQLNPGKSLLSLLYSLPGLTGQVNQSGLYLHGTGPWLVETNGYILN